MKLGAPPFNWTDELQAEFFERLSNGESVRSICRREHMPASSTVFKTLANDEAFAERYARAKQAGLELLADELVDIADDGVNDWMQNNDPDNPGYAFHGEHVQRSKLRVDARKWVLAKLVPHKYGERQTITHDVTDSLAERLQRARERIGN